LKGILYKLRIYFHYKTSLKSLHYFAFKFTNDKEKEDFLIIENNQCQLILNAYFPRKTSEIHSCEEYCWNSEKTIVYHTLRAEPLL